MGQGGEVNSGKRKLFKESCRKRFEVKNLSFRIMLSGFEPQLAPSSLTTESYLSIPSVKQARFLKGCYRDLK